MNAKTYKIVYFISTGLISLLMLVSSTFYFIDYENVSKVFISLGYPTYIIIPLAIAKILGIIAIWTRKSNTLMEWAYAGFFFDFVLAFAAHTHIKDGEQFTAAIAVLVLLISYYSGKKMLL